jgi:hypothetical protein
MPNEKLEINAIFTPMDMKPPVSLSHLLNLPFQALPELIPELTFKYFTGRVLGKGIGKFYGFGRLVVSKLVPAEN